MAARCERMRYAATRNAQCICCSHIQVIAIRLRETAPKVKMPVQGPAGIQGAFSWKAAKDPTLNKTCTVTLVNDVASY